MQIIHVALSTVTVSSLPAAVLARGMLMVSWEQLNVAQHCPHPETSLILSIAADIASLLPSSSFSSFSFFFFLKEGTIAR